MSSSSSKSNESLLHFSFTNMSSISSSSDEKMLGEWDQHIIIFLSLALGSSNSSNFSNSNELEPNGQPSINHAKGVHDQLVSVRVIPTQFKHLTKVTLNEFEDLCLDLCPTIALHAHTMDKLWDVGGDPIK